MNIIFIWILTKNILNLEIYLDSPIDLKNAVVYNKKVISELIENNKNSTIEELEHSNKLQIEKLNKNIKSIEILKDIFKNKSKEYKNKLNDLNKVKKDNKLFESVLKNLPKKDLEYINKINDLRKNIIYFSLYLKPIFVNIFENYDDINIEKILKTQTDEFDNTMDTIIKQEYENKDKNDIIFSFRNITKKDTKINYLNKLSNVIFNFNFLYEFRNGNFCLSKYKYNILKKIENKIKFNKIILDSKINKYNLKSKKYYGLLFSNDYINNFKDMILLSESVKSLKNNLNLYIKKIMEYNEVIISLNRKILENSNLIYIKKV